MNKKYPVGLIFSMFLILLMSCISCNSSRTIALEEGWDLLGESKANFVRDKDGIDVMTGASYTAIRFKVEKKDIHLKDLEIVYVNGDKLSPTLDDDITAGQYSRVIELGPEGKMIKSVEFNYRSKGSLLKSRARVMVFGKRYRPY